MILVDSSGWIEYLADRPRADAFAPYIEASEPPLVSVVSFCEVYKVIRRDLSEERAVEAVSFLGRGEIVPVDDCLALEAADAALELGLAMADALILATARRRDAHIVTGDADFEGLPNATSSADRGRAPARPRSAVQPIGEAYSPGAPRTSAPPRSRTSCENPGAVHLRSFRRGRGRDPLAERRLKLEVDERYASGTAERTSSVTTRAPSRARSASDSE